MWSKQPHLPLHRRYCPEETKSSEDGCGRWEEISFWANGCECRFWSDQQRVPAQISFQPPFPLPRNLFFPVHQTAQESYARKCPLSPYATAVEQMANVQRDLAEC